MEGLKARWVPQERNAKAASSFCILCTHAARLEDLERCCLPDCCEKAWITF